MRNQLPVKVTKDIFAILAQLLQGTHPVLGGTSLVLSQLFDYLLENDNKELLGNLRDALGNNLQEAIDGYLHEHVDDDTEAMNLWHAALSFITSHHLEYQAWLACTTHDDVMKALFSLPDAQQTLEGACATHKVSTEKVREIITVCYGEIFKKRNDIYGLEARLMDLWKENNEVLALQILELEKSVREKLGDIAQQQENIQNQLYYLPQLIAQAQQTIDITRALTLISIQEAPYIPKRHAPSSVLQTSSDESVPLWGREDERDDLHAWCRPEHEELVAVRSYAAKGGTGKTRLLLETCKTLKKEGWQAGFLSETMTQEDAKLLKHFFGLDCPLFLVVDYAERQARTYLLPLFNALASQDEKLKHKVRIVLLSRDTRNNLREAEWFREASHSTFFDSYGSDILDIKQLAPLASDADSRRAFLSHAAKHFAEVLGNTQPPAQIETLCHHQDITPAYLERALYLQILALQIVLEGSTQKLKGEQALLDYVIRREEKFLKTCLSVNNEDLSKGLWQAFMVFTAVDNINDVNAKTLLRKIPLLKDVTEAQHDHIANILQQSYGTKQSWINPVLPDLVLEQLYGTLADDSYRDALLEILLDVAQGAVNVQAFLIHVNALAQRESEQGTGEQKAEKLLQCIFAKEQPAEVWIAAIEATKVGTYDNSLAKIMEEAFTANPDGELASQIVWGLPKNTVSLLNFAVIVTQKAREFYKKIEDYPNYVALLNNLSVFLGNTGERETALEAIEEAVDAYQELAKNNADAFMPDLAASLNNLSGRLSALGKREAALEAVEEAVEIRQALAKKNADAFMPDLAMSLNNLSNCFRDLGQREKALKAVEESVKIRRALAENNADAFMPDLAMSLNTLSNCRRDLGQREKALKAVEKAVEIRQALAKKNADAFMPYLAASLNNLSTCLSDLGKREAALEASEAALGNILPFFQQYPLAAVHNVQIMLQVYAESCQALGKEPEETMLVPFFKIFQQLEDARG